jgi:hypothetical protein
MLLPFNFLPGSTDSLERLKTLKQLGMSGLYGSEVAQRFVAYKMTQVRVVAMTKLTFYCLYLLLINIYAENWMLLTWAFYFAVIEMI